MSLRGWASAEMAEVGSFMMFPSSSQCGNGRFSLGIFPSETQQRNSSRDCTVRAGYCRLGLYVKIHSTKPSDKRIHRDLRENLAAPFSKEIYLQQFRQQSNRSNNP
jgi:hypothetical protein